MVILCGTMEFLLRNIPNDYQLKKDYLDHNAQNIEVLILGSSHFYRAINPQFLTLNSFNAAYVSQTVDIDESIFKKYENKLTNLKYLVLDISNLSLFYELRLGPENWRMKNYNIYYDLPITTTLAQHSELLSMKFDISLKRIFSYYIFKRSEITSSSLGWGSFGSLQNKKGLIKTGEAALQRHNITDFSYFPAVTQKLDSIIKIASEKNIKVILLTTPLSEFYRDGLSIKMLEKNNAFLENLIKRCETCSYLDWSHDSSFSDNDFFDGDHLNEVGAKKLSLKLDSVILNDEQSR